MISSGAAFGVAHDGDADRAVFVDENGKFIEENAEFALIATAMCSRENGIIVTPVSTSLILEMVAKMKGCSVTYTPVGSIYVARAMRSLIENGADVVFGGEGNGGLIFPEHQFCRDGGMTAAMMVQILATQKRPLSKLVNNLPERNMIKGKIKTHSGEKLIEFIRNEYTCILVDETDGIKIFRDDSWALIRASGTEPLVRVIVDAPSVERGTVIYEEIMEKIQSFDQNQAT